MFNMIFQKVRSVGAAAFQVNIEAFSLIFWNPRGPGNKKISPFYLFSSSNYFLIPIFVT